VFDDLPERGSLSGWCRNPQWRFSNDRTAEPQALIEAMEKM
jgi:hypothetical protein